MPDAALRRQAEVREADFFSATLPEGAFHRAGPYRAARPSVLTANPDQKTELGPRFGPPCAIFVPAELGTFDVIYDCTFLCAIQPEMRQQWAAQHAALLKPDGELVTLMCVSFLPELVALCVYMFLR
jgi:hypothetical protein